MIDLKKMKGLIRFMETNGLIEFEQLKNGRRIRIRRAEQAPAAPAPAAPAPEGIPIKSPFVGIFRRSRAPMGGACVYRGSSVEPDTVLCIVEAMDVSYEVRACTRGTVRDILVADGQAVEYGEPIFVIEKS